MLILIIKNGVPKSPNKTPPQKDCSFFSVAASYDREMKDKRIQVVKEIFINGID